MGETVFIGTVIFGVLAIAVANICEGVWKIEKVETCENHQQYPMDMEVMKRKINRTHDGFSLKIKLDENFDAAYDLRLEGYEKVDGGRYKDSDVVVAKTCDFLNEFAKDNFQDILGRAGIEPKDCPIPKGEWEVHDYVINYESLPEQAKCGEYKWLVYIIKNYEKMSCITAYTTFTRKDGDDEEE